MMLIQHSVNSDWRFNTQSRLLQADWLIGEKATLNDNMPYKQTCSIHKTTIHHYTLFFFTGNWHFCRE